MSWKWRTLTFSVLAFSLLTSSSMLSVAAEGPASVPSISVQDQSPSVLRANTRLVVVDVVATNGKGEPVPDLKVEDFTVTEDGKPQKISAFSFKQHNKAAQVTGVTGRGFSNAPQYKDVSSLNVILLDSINGNFDSHAYGRDELLKFLDKGTLTQPTALYVLEQKLILLHDFTTDIAELKALVEGYKPKGTSRVQDVYAAASPFSERAPANSTTVNTMDISVNALNTLASALAGYPGRKNLIWVSAGFPITLFPEIINDTNSGVDTSIDRSLQPGLLYAQFGSGQGTGKDFEKAVEKAANALMNAQIAVYPIDETGVLRDNRINIIQTMRSLADRTGGKAFYNSNDVELGIRSSLDDGSTYYTLEYYPTNKTWDSKFRSIQLKTKAGITLRYRQGYYALEPGNNDKNKDADKVLTKTFSDALSLDSPSATAVVFHAGVAPPSDKAQKVTVSFAIDPHTISFEHKDDGLEHAVVSCAVAAYSDKGAPVKQASTTMTAAMKADEFQTMMKGQQFPCTQTIDLKPGSYNLALGVLDRNSKLIGTTTAWVKVP
ncbi:MAG TPA: VWA domain-containing protein [Candidatus Angelobacter sp.]|jgi:VWFA-related protein|nr:VWA domain-containing protein [Candidatus Angelobacter sp.]